MEQSKQDGFSLVEAIITMVLGSIVIFAFYDLYTQTVRISQDTLERAYALNMAARYLDEGRYTASLRYYDTDTETASNQAELAQMQYMPEARGKFREQSWTTNYTPTLQLRTTTITYGPPNARKTVTLKAFIRYDGGMYF
ncbi:prepilin-type N-terminal cleavage/methylation domain-containing protein [Candidatus Saccharibacteria bacterium]|nr:prepilin-type N-terminal cleavage/methylation domain-containing protein [Candidatus Saccharibacteria bacterium]